MKEKKKMVLASVKAEKSVVKDARRICVDEEKNLYEYVTEAIRQLNIKGTRIKLAKDVQK